MENDVIIEDIQERSITAQSTDADDSVDGDDNASEGSASDTNHGKVKRSSSLQGESIVNSDVDPKIKKGLEKIRKLDAILADKIKVKGSNLLLTHSLSEVANARQPIGNGTFRFSK